MSGGGQVFAPHIQFENALFFYNKTGFLRSNTTTVHFFFHFTLCLSPQSVRIWVLLGLFVCGCICFNQSNLIFLLCSTFILGQTVEIRCDIFCPLNHPNNTTVNGESVLHLFFWSFAFFHLFVFSVFVVAHCFDHFTVCLLLVEQCGFTYTREAFRTTARRNNP